MPSFQFDSSAFISCHFPKGALMVGAPVSGQHRPFTNWPFGNGNTKLPTKIAFQDNAVAWGYHCDRSGFSDKYEPLDGYFKAMGMCLISKPDSIWLFTKFLGLALAHVRNASDGTVQNWSYLFIIPGTWQTEHITAFRQVLTALSITDAAILPETEAGAYYFVLKYPNQDGVLVLTREADEAHIGTYMVDPESSIDNRATWPPHCMLGSLPFLMFQTLGTYQNRGGPLAVSRSLFQRLEAAPNEQDVLPLVKEAIRQAHRPRIRSVTIPEAQMLTFRLRLLALSRRPSQTAFKDFWSRPTCFKLTGIPQWRP